jgi:cytochrome bd-type quinol oxidase subunit 1
VHPIVKEAQMLGSWSARHRRLVGRVGLVLLATMLADALGTLGMYFFEHGSHSKMNQIHSLGDALFFSTVQILTVSSQMQNPVTTAGRVVDVALEIWAVLVVAGSAGAIASFFQDDPRSGSSS